MSERILKAPPPMHPNAVHALYMDHLNRGALYLGQLGGHPISIDEWRDRELARWEAENPKPPSRSQS